MFWNRRMFWKVRPIPRCVISCGLRLRLQMPKRFVSRTSSPSKTIRPAVGGKIPVTRLKNVVLPAPFGPISPTIRPSSTSRSTSSRAAKPPKRFVTLSASRSATSGPRRPGVVQLFLHDGALQLRVAPFRREEPLRPEDHDDDEGDPEVEEAVLLEPTEDLRDQDDEDGSEERAGDRPHPT